MKKLFALFVILVNSSLLFGQSLYNTTWAVYRPDTSLASYCHLGNDTLSFSFDKTTYENSSTFTVSGNNFSIRTYTNSSCGSSIGQYTFSIQNDTLDFGVINDVCSLRKGVIADFYWVRLHLPTRIPEIEKESSIVMYPNPTQGLLTIPAAGNKHVIISNSQGQIIVKIFTDLDTVELKELMNGYYFVSVYNDHDKLIGYQKLVYEK
jgi:hypothetical protein